jgi:hypothetical protein
MKIVDKKKEGAVDNMQACALRSLTNSNKQQFLFLRFEELG